jgi:hypothetical protein
MDNYYYKKLKYESKYNDTLEIQQGGSWFNFSKKKEPAFEIPFIPVHHQLNISAEEINVITSNDYHHLFGNNSNPDFNEKIFRLLNNTSFLLYKDNDVIKKTLISGNTLLSNFIIERINYTIENTCLVSREIYIYYNWYFYSQSIDKNITFEKKSIYKISDYHSFDNYIGDLNTKIYEKMEKLNEFRQKEKSEEWKELSNKKFLLDKLDNKLTNLLPHLQKNVDIIDELINNIRINRCNNYIYIPIVLAPTQIFGNEKKSLSYHANGLLINIKDNPPTWIRIEPQTPNYSEQVDRNSTFERIVLDVTGAERCIHLQINEVCPPQHITQDTNCMFWSLLILNKICDMIKNGKDPLTIENEYHQGLLDNLKEKMDNWKRYIVDYLIPECLSKYHFIWPIYNELFTNNNMIQRLNQIRSLTNLEYIPWFFKEINITVHASDADNQVLEKFEEDRGIGGGQNILLDYYERYA